VIQTNERAWKDFSKKEEEEIEYVATSLRGHRASEQISHKFPHASSKILTDHKNHERKKEDLSEEESGTKMGPRCKGNVGHFETPP
jgi:hypothetical protein